MTRPWSRITLLVALGLTFLFASCTQQENAPVSAISTGGEAFLQKPGTDFNGPHYNLNVIGVPHDKLFGNFDNTNRHTIFIPLYTDWYADPCLTSGPNSNKGDVPGVVSELPSKGVRLRIGPSADGSFSVTDGNATDDKYAELLMPATPNGYDVWISGKGKPGGCLDIDAYLIDSLTYYFIGHVDVDRKTGEPTWQNAKWLLYGSNGTAFFADPNDLYFWQLYNNGLRLMQVRFYPTAG
jgi:hypothetical protein